MGIQSANNVTNIKHDAGINDAENGSNIFLNSQDRAHIANFVNKLHLSFSVMSTAASVSVIPYI